MPLRRLPDMVESKPCNHREHEPPSMVYLKPGRYEHTCPGCGHVTYFSVPEVQCAGIEYKSDGPDLRVRLGRWLRTKI